MQFRQLNTWQEAFQVNGICFWCSSTSQIFVLSLTNGFIDAIQLIYLYCLLFKRLPRMLNGVFRTFFFCSLFFLFFSLFSLCFSFTIYDQVWIFGDLWCSIWLAVDVWMCTASILNLCAISLDRYVAVTRPVTYPSIMSTKRAKLLVAGVWVLSFVICLPQLVGLTQNHKVRLN